MDAGRPGREKTAFFILLNYGISSVADWDQATAGDVIPDCVRFDGERESSKRERESPAAHIDCSDPSWHQQRRRRRRSGRLVRKAFPHWSV